MFDLIFQGVQAYNQVGFFIGAVVCLGIGGLILGNTVYWRVHALRAQGTVIGVIANGGTYTPVYRYTLADGQSHVARSDTGSGWVRGKETGRVVPLMISAHNPTQAREAGGYLLDLVGLVFAVPGILFGYTALTAYPITRMTWIMAAAMLLYLGERAWRVVIPKGQRLSVEEWKKQHNIGQATLDLTDVKPIETIVSAPDVAQARLKQSQSYKIIFPILAAVAVLLLGIGVFQSLKISRLEVHGLRAQGRVVRVNSEHSSGSGEPLYLLSRRAVSHADEFDCRIQGQRRHQSAQPSNGRPGDRALFARRPAAAGDHRPRLPAELGHPRNRFSVCRRSRHALHCPAAADEGGGGVGAGGDQRCGPLRGVSVPAHTLSTNESTTRFSPALSKRDGELVAVHGDDVAVAEFLVKHALADGEG